MSNYAIVRYDGYATTNSSTENIVPMVTIDGYDINGASDNYVLYLDCTCLAISRYGSIGGATFQRLAFTKLDGWFINESTFGSAETAGLNPPNAITPRYDQDTGDIHVDVVGPANADECQLQLIVVGQLFNADDFT